MPSQLTFYIPEGLQGVYFVITSNNLRKKGSCAYTAIESAQASWKNSTSMSAASARFSTIVAGLLCRPQVLHCLGELFSIVSAARQQMIIMAFHISLVIEMLAQCTCLSLLSNIKWILLLFLFQNSISTPLTVVDVPPILNKTIKSGHHLCFLVWSWGLIDLTSY